jgi:hypothetical protein
MYGVQWMASHPTFMGMDCAVKLAELALAADRVFVPMASVRAPDLADDQTIPDVLRRLLNSTSNADGFIFDLRRAEGLDVRGDMERIVHERLQGEAGAVSAWISHWTRTITSTEPLVQSAIAWISKQPSTYSALSRRIDQRVSFPSWEPEAGDRVDEKLAKNLATHYGAYETITSSTLGSLFTGKIVDAATDTDRTLYVILVTILLRSIVYQEESAYLDRVIHPHPLRMPILSAAEGLFDPPVAGESRTVFLNFLRPTDPQAVGLGCSLPLVLPLITQRLQIARGRLRKLLKSPDEADRQHGERALISSYCDDLLNLHSSPFALTLRSELAEIERDGNAKGLRDQLNRLNKFVAATLELQPIEMAVEIVEELPGVTLKSMISPFRVVFAGLLVEAEAHRGSIQRLSFLKRTRLSRSVILVLRRMAEERTMIARTQSGRGAYAAPQ